MSSTKKDAAIEATVKRSETAAELRFISYLEKPVASISRKAAARPRFKLRPYSIKHFIRSLQEATESAAYTNIMQKNPT